MDRQTDNRDLGGNRIRMCSWHVMGYWQPPTKNKNPPHLPVLKMLGFSQSSKFLLPHLTWNKQDVKLMQKPLIQHNCQKEKRIKSEEI